MATNAKCLRVGVIHGTTTPFDDNLGLWPRVKPRGIKDEASNHYDLDNIAYRITSNNSPPSNNAPLE